jgi:hypothetical protein
VERNAATEDNRRALKRIVALLFAFAVLAERLCNLPRPVRSFVLSILRYAETIARDFVIDTALDQGAALPPVLLIPALQDGDTAADAMRLARDFRALAVLLDRLADGNPGHCAMRITKLCLALAECVASQSPAPGMSFGGSRSGLAPAHLAVERHDSS